MGHIANYSEGTVRAVCPACESHDVKEHWEVDNFQYGDGKSAAQLSVRVPVCLCMNCDLEYTDERAERIRHASVCEHLGILPPEAVLAIRERYGMSQMEFAELSKIGRASLARWESGALFQNASSDSLLFLLGFEENVERLTKRGLKADAADEPVKTVAARRFRCIADEEVVAIRRESLTFNLFTIQ